MISDFEYLGSLWLKGKKLIPFNVCTSAVLWIIWKTRNNICFQGPAGQRWKRCLAGVRSCTGTRRCWTDRTGANQLEEWACLMERRSAGPPCLPWRQERRNSKFSVSESGWEANALSNVIDTVTDFESLELNLVWTLLCNKVGATFCQKNTFREREREVIGLEAAKTRTKIWNDVELREITQRTPDSRQRWSLMNSCGQLTWTLRSVSTQ